MDRAIAFRGLGDRRLTYADRFLRLVDQGLVRHRRLEEFLADLLADHDDGRAGAGGRVRTARHGRRRQIAVADEDRDLVDGAPSFSAAAWPITV
jgi:hypothetical protein